MRAASRCRARFRNELGRTRLAKYRAYSGDCIRSPRAAVEGRQIPHPARLRDQPPARLQGVENAVEQPIVIGNPVKRGSAEYGIEGVDEGKRRAIAADIHRSVSHDFDSASLTGFPVTRTLTGARSCSIAAERSSPTTRIPGVRRDLLRQTSRAAAEIENALALNGARRAATARPHASCGSEMRWYLAASQSDMDSVYSRVRTSRVAQQPGAVRRRRMRVVLLVSSLAVAAVARTTHVHSCAAGGRKASGSATSPGNRPPMFCARRPSS